eukprot:TRINITY_DN907_c5_g1_i2.p1 TRINITY_DN907_c5_g1~~TRINITY_DN907_c5_g1_i2.p1  ORF type:complete len:531 (+),score=169.83 TRINITY_DN907_c5_g1_i2:105-1697(+)
MTKFNRWGNAKKSPEPTGPVQMDGQLQEQTADAASQPVNGRKPVSVTVGSPSKAAAQASAQQQQQQQQAHAANGQMQYPMQYGGYMNGMAYMMVQMGTMPYPVQQQAVWGQTMYHHMQRDTAGKGNEASRADEDDNWRAAKPAAAGGNADAFGASASSGSPRKRWGGNRGADRVDESYDQMAQQYYAAMPADAAAVYHQQQMYIQQTAKFGHTQHGGSSSSQPRRQDHGPRGGCRQQFPPGMPRHVKISKSLTQVLRHKATDLGIDIRSDGYCSLDAIMALPWLKELNCTKADVEQVVRESDKKRFELKEETGMCYIRAVQGHSIKTIDDEQLLRKLLSGDPDMPTTCVHGTYLRFLQSILAKGLIAGGGQGQGYRNHIHCAPREPRDKRVISGMRYDCEVAIYIDLQRALREGVPFYMSANEVILSPGKDGILETKYFIKVVNLMTQQQIWPGAAEPSQGFQQQQQQQQAAAALPVGRLKAQQQQPATEQHQRNGQELGSGREQQSDSPPPPLPAAAERQTTPADVGTP